LAVTFFLLAAADSTRLLVDAWRGVEPARPRSSSAWIDTGLAAEEAGDYAGAERSLLEAARIDRQHLPAWSLANFYFRRGDPASFWPWARRAAALEL
jgi:Tfp pilus assembly protein PilF